MDRIKLVHELFLKVAKNYITPAYDYEPPALEKMADFATSIGLVFSHPRIYLISKV